MDIANFLSDLLVVQDLATVIDFDKLFDIKNSCLDYKSLFSHERFKSVMVFVTMFHDIFGYYPSFAFVEAVLSGIHVWDANIVSERLVGSTFLKYVRADIGLYKAYEKAKFAAAYTLRSISSDVMAAKHHAWEWLARDLGDQEKAAWEVYKEKTLYSLYNDLLKSKRNPGMRNITQMPEISVDVLDWNGVFVYCPYNHDARSHFMTLNMNYFRSVFGRVLVIVDDSSVSVDDAVKVTRAITSFFDKERLCLVACDKVCQLLRVERNVSVIRRTEYVPANCAALCFHVLGCEKINVVSLGLATIVRPIWVISKEVDNYEFIKSGSGALIAVSQRNLARKVVSNMLPEIVLPLFAIQPIINSYFQMNMDLKKDKESERGRAAIYSAVIPNIIEKIEKVKDGKPHNAILLIDTRANGLSLMSACLAWSAISRTQNDWTIVIGTESRNRDFYKTYIPFAKFLDHKLLDSKPFDIEAYNDMLKSSELWDSLGKMGIEKCFIVQDDGLVVRPTRLASWFGDLVPYTYIAAPWLPCEANKEVDELTKGRMVGNGGACIRSVKKMAEIVKANKDMVKVLFNGRLQHIQEDVFYAKFNENVPSIQEASMFSMEQIYNPNCACVHKPWMYHPLDKIMELARMIVKGDAW